MQSGHQSQYDWAATLPTSRQTQQGNDPNPPMSANVNGPVDPLEFYHSFSSDTASISPSFSIPTRQGSKDFQQAVIASRSYSQSPERARIRSRTPNILAPAQQRLSGAKSQPVLNNKSRQATTTAAAAAAAVPARVKDLADKFEQDVSVDYASMRPADEKHRRPTSQISPQSPPSSPQRGARLQKRKPLAISKDNTPNTSFSSDAATVISTQSQPAPYVARKPTAPPKSTRPLFGEITADGQWNGNFDIASFVVTTDDYFSSSRRGSDGDLSLGSRRHSQIEALHPGFHLPLPVASSHTRSRSDMTAMRSTYAPDLSPLNLQSLPTQPLENTSPVTNSQPSRIPVRGRPVAATSSTNPPTFRSTSALSSPVDRAKTPVYDRPSAATKENAKTTLHSRRYNPPPLPQTTQLLSAKVVAPLPKVSPPLRSSRPRQPVSSATTAASRARAAQASPVSPASTKRPSEQWLGKPYDPKQERSRRKIPELGKVDFAERRARIQKALSQNLEHSQSLESLKSRSSAASRASNPQTSAGADDDNTKTNTVDQHQADEFEQETQNLGLGSDITVVPPREQLSIATSNLLPVKNADNDTATSEYTNFEIESPQSVETTVHATAPTSTESPGLMLLSATTYQPPEKKKAAVPIAPNDLSRPHSDDDSPSDIEDKWGLKRSIGEQGSIKIMLDSQPELAHQTNDQTRTQDGQHVDPAASATTAPSVGPGTEAQQLPPQTAKSSISPEDDTFIMRAINRYRDTGIIEPELLEQMDNYTVDLHRISANGPNAALVRNLLDSIAAQKALDSSTPEAAQTPRTPASFEHAGTALVFASRSLEITPERRSHDAVIGSDDEDDFAAQIRKADQEWERQQRGEGPMFSDDDSKPDPPPKDQGYTPRSSLGPRSSLEAAWTDAGQVEPVSQRTGVRTMPSKNVDSVISEEAVIAASQIPPPGHAPPPPPALPYGMQDAEHKEPLPTPMRKTFSGLGSNSSRPSVDSQQQRPLASQSVTSIDDPTKVAPAGGENSPNASPGPEQKRLHKRRHVIRELLDTEKTYHQDLKIIEDIYKGTVSDVVNPEDKKILFGNCDDIEQFSLQFYSQLKKAASAMYTPSKSLRWGNRRGSISTTQSDATGQTSVISTEYVDEDKDRATFIGRVFLDNLGRMEQLYGAYLRNHDAANQRLSALQSNPQVKYWLNECHNSASDITSAWDLDSLLVKPTQRVSKYPLILQQLLDTTAAGHPDYDNLKNAITNSVAMLTRINEAKKRSDLVEQMISGKNKDTDVRSGLAKAFGRRTERLKERVGISEAFQDPEFDALAQAFGGHYIRLQVVMRDFQDYSNQVDRAIQNTNNIASALDQFTDVHQSSLPEIESKWRRYGQVIRELTNISLMSHKTAVQQRVIQPLISLIKLYEGPQKAIAKRKKHIVDYAKCKSIERRGEKPDRKTIEASEMYLALNDQLKIELPKLYTLTAQLVVACLRCFLNSQLEFEDTWQRKLAPLLSTPGGPSDINEIIPAFTADYEEMKARLNSLAICNGSLLAETAKFLSPSMPNDESFGRSRRGTGSETPSTSKRQSMTHTPDLPPLEAPILPPDHRMRSDSSMSHTGRTPVTPIANLTAANRPWSESVATPPASGYNTRPSTANQSSVRSSMEQRSRHDSTATYVTAQVTPYDDGRFSNIFSSAMPPAESNEANVRAMSPTPVMRASEDTKTLFVCASLYEFNIDKARREAGYPYLTYEQGEVFDVVAHKGELWLAKNQDDAENNLGWIWEQHFVVLGSD